MQPRRLKGDITSMDMEWLDNAIHTEYEPPAMLSKAKQSKAKQIEA